MIFYANFLKIPAKKRLHFQNSILFGIFMSLTMYDRDFLKHFWAFFVLKVSVGLHG